MKVRYLRAAPAPGTQLAEAERFDVYEHAR